MRRLARRRVGQALATCEAERSKTRDILRPDSTGTLDGTQVDHNRLPPCARPDDER
jgi:hypothetical protein